jgi:hypothetical protein
LDPDPHPAFHVNPDPVPGFDDQRLEKNAADKMISLIKKLLQFTYP